MGRRSLFHPHGQAAPQARDGNRDPVQCGSARGFRRARRRDHTQSAHPSHSTRGGHLAALFVQAAGSWHEPTAGFDGFQLRIELRRAVAHSVRDAAAGCHDRRCDALYAAGYGRGELGRGGADLERVARPQVRFSKLSCGNLWPQGGRRHAGAARPRLEAALSTTIQPQASLRELAARWVTLGKESAPDQASGVLRACTMTLLTVVEESEDTSDIWSVMPALIPEHPSRAIVIRFRPSAERALSSRVFSQCWMPFGQRRQICCEQIEITASDASLPDL